MKLSRMLKGKYVIVTIVCLVFGYMISFSYQFTKKQLGKTGITSSQYERDMKLRDNLIELEEKNQQIHKKLKYTQQEVLEVEEELSNKTHTYYNLTEETEKYRMYLGKVKVKGQGVEVTLADGDYNPSEQNANQYIVHDHQIFRVVNELFISGANAIAINGQRLTHDSYILCNGPVIEIDGYQHPAPFIITAIGDPDTMAAALNIKGGVKDLLVNENVQFSLVKRDEIVIQAKLNS